MPEPSAFDYAVVRIVPEVTREEFVNVGVILFCRTRHFLGARLHLDRARLATLDPALDVKDIEAQLALIPAICQGGPEAGPFADLSQSERFHWLVSPRSTVVQVSPVHPGLTTDPQAALDDLFGKLVR